MLAESEQLKLNELRQKNIFVFKALLISGILDAMFIFTLHLPMNYIAILLILVFGLLGIFSYGLFLRHRLLPYLPYITIFIIGLMMMVSIIGRPNLTNTFVVYFLAAFACIYMDRRVIFASIATGSDKTVGVTNETGAAFERISSSVNELLRFAEEQHHFMSDIGTSAKTIEQSTGLLSSVSEQSQATIEELSATVET